MSANALLAATRAIADLLVSAVTTSNQVFVGPLDDPRARGAVLILYLYRIVPIASLRNREHRVLNPAPPPAVLAYENALPLELHYLLTIGDPEDGASMPNLGALGRAMQVLNSEAALSGISVGQESVNLSLDPLSSEEMSRVWTLFPTANYRTSVAYVASPVWIDPQAETKPAGRVLTDEFRGGHAEREAASV